MTALTLPSIFNRDYAHDFPEVESGWAIQAKRVALVALPLISLYQPLGFSLALGLGGLRTIASLAQLVESDPMGMGYDLFQTAVSVAALAGTVFAHPLGMMITTVHDLGIELKALVESQEDNEQVVKNLITSCNHALYLTLLVFGGVELTALFLAGQVCIAVYSSCREMQKDHYLEAGGHLLMAVVRGMQFNAQIPDLFEKVGTRCMHLANHLHSPARFFSSCVERVTRVWKYGEEGFEKTYSEELVTRVTLGIGALVALPFMVGSFLAIPVTALAARLRDRIEILAPLHPRTPQSSGEPLSVLVRNVALQEGPFAPLTAGVVAPFEKSGESATRLDRLCDEIQKMHKDVLLFQEVHGINAQNVLGARLQEMGYYVALDRGLDVACNNSGLLIASLNPLENVRFIEYPLEDRAGLARWTLQGALTARISGIFFINTHLNYQDTEEAQSARIRQLSHILPLFRRDEPTVLAGDLNFDTNFVVEGKTLLERAGFVGYNNLCGGIATCTNEGKARLRGVFASDEKDDAVIPNQAARIYDLKITPDREVSDHAQITFTVVQKPREFS